MDQLSTAIAPEVFEQDCSDLSDLRKRTDTTAIAAAASCDAVDRAARFPTEAFAVAREQRLLGMLIPSALGGDGARISDVVNVCYGLGRSCTSTAMIFAMHQLNVEILIRHSRGSEWHRQLLQRIAAGQLLVASSTTEGKGGGNLRSSSCAVEQTGSRMTLEKDASVVSYGEEADIILATARRSIDALPSDQVLAVLEKNNYQLERTGGWDALGMRGTCSTGFMIRARGDIAQLLPEPYEKIHTHTMMPVAHLTWSGVWAGLAAGAVERAQRFVRMAARKAGQQPPGVAHLTRAAISLRTLRAAIASGLARYEHAVTEAGELKSLEFQTAMNLLKVSSSELAVSIVLNAMQVCGLAGYRNHGEFSVSRHLRDVMSSPIMISNDRILSSSATASLLLGVPLLLSE